MADDMTASEELTRTISLEESANDSSSFDSSLKKKKKPKKSVAFEDEMVANEDHTPSAEQHSLSPEPAASDPAVDEVTEMFSNLKKKKKKKPVPGFDDAALDDACGMAAAEDDDAPADEAEDEEIDFSKMKKKKSKKREKTAVDTSALDKELEEAGVGSKEDEGDTLAERSLVGGDEDYSYQELLQRIFSLLRTNNPELSSDTKKKYTMVPPTVMREGNKKTIFANIANICQRMRRSPDHVIQFIFAELGTSGSVDGASRLVIKGKFQQKQLENVLRRYLLEYVACKTCKSPDTVLSKENRLYFLDCESCGSRRSVAAIKTGFQAHVGKRKKLRA